MNKQQIIYRLLHEQHITPEEAEVLMQEPEWKYNPAWKITDSTQAVPSNPLDWPKHTSCSACRNGGTCNCILGGYKVTCNNLTCGTTETNSQFLIKKDSKNIVITNT